MAGESQRSSRGDPRSRTRHAPRSTTPAAPAHESRCQLEGCQSLGWPSPNFARDGPERAKNLKSERIYLGLCANSSPRGLKAFFSYVERVLSGRYARPTARRWCSPSRGGAARRRERCGFHRRPHRHAAEPQGRHHDRYGAGRLRSPRWLAW